MFMAVNLKTVQGRRPLHFETYDDIRRDVQQLMQRSVSSLGNWTVGQNLHHLAKSFDASIDGMGVQLPGWMRLIAKAFKGWFLSRPFKPGFKLPASMEPALGPDHDVSTDDGFRMLLAAIDRIERDPRRARSPAFGEMPESDWIKLHCRHSELHLSFLVNEPPGTAGASGEEHPGSGYAGRN
jgi:hypothetical protein